MTTTFTPQAGDEAFGTRADGVPFYLRLARPPFPLDTERVALEDDSMVIVAFTDTVEYQRQGAECNTLFCTGPMHSGDRHVDVTGYSWTEALSDFPVIARAYSL